MATLDSLNVDNFNNLSISNLKKMMCAPKIVKKKYPTNILHKEKHTHGIVLALL